MNRPRSHNNQAVLAFLTAYDRAFDLFREHPAVEDIFTGVLELRSPGDSATRTLSRRVIFNVLKRCPRIDVAAVTEVTGGKYAYRTAASYAAVARVASKAIEGYLGGDPKGIDLMLPSQRDRDELDAPYRLELQALGLMVETEIAT